MRSKRTSEWPSILRVDLIVISPTVRRRVKDVLLKKHLDHSKMTLSLFRLRLNRLFEENKVHLGSHPDGKPEDWFNVFILHQNRARGEDGDKEGKAIAEERIGGNGSIEN